MMEEVDVSFDLTIMQSRHMVPVILTPERLSQNNEYLQSQTPSEQIYR